MADPRTFIFQEARENRLHPTVQYWEDALAGEVVDHLQVAVRQSRHGLYKGLPKLAAIGLRRDGTMAAQPTFVDWEMELHEGFIRLGAKATDFDTEALRFALAMEERFRPIERRYGDGYFNTVLLNVLVQTGLAASKVVKSVLASVHRGGTVLPSTSAEDCKSRILGVLQRSGDELTSGLNYSESEALGVIAAALALFLDSRFSVSTRRALGWA